MAKPGKITIPVHVELDGASVTDVQKQIEAALDYMHRRYGTGSVVEGGVVGSPRLSAVGRVVRAVGGAVRVGTVAGAAGMSVTAVYTVVLPYLRLGRDVVRYLLDQRRG